MRLRLLPLFFALASCGARDEPGHLRVALMPHTSYAALILARENGDFAEQGLEVEFVRMGSSMGAVPILERGDLDVLPAFLGPGLLNAIARGGGLRIVAAQTRLSEDHCAYMAIVAREGLLEERVLTPAAGAPLAVSADVATVGEFIVWRALTADARPIEFRIEPLSDEVEARALETSGIDLALMGEPWLSRYLESHPGSIWRVAAEVAPDLQTSVVAFGPRLLERDPELGVRFLRGYLNGVRRFRQGKTPDNVAAISAVTGLDPELIESNCWPTIPVDGIVDTTSVQTFQEWAAGKGYLDRVLQVERWWEPSFLERAAAGPISDRAGSAGDRR